MVAKPGTLPLAMSLPGLMSGDAVVITLPVEGYENVARLVAGGLASRLELGFETVDDIQLAVELVLRSIPDRGASATVSLLEDGHNLVVEIGPVGGLTLAQQLRPLDGSGIALGASLERLVDAVELKEGPEAAIVLTKGLSGIPT